jgi:isoleucyl-tRNA synthetase
VTVTEELRKEGLARELVNRIQNIRKDSGFEVTDRITVEIQKMEMLEGAIESFGEFIAQQTLANSVVLAEQPAGGVVVDSDIDEQPLKIAVTKVK